MVLQSTGASASTYFIPSSRIRLAQLCPQASPDTHIEAVITLVWPFSSVTGTLSLLLAEPEVQLRRSKGQVKVTLHGRGARDVAKSQAGIGDTVRLSLLGAKWIHTGEVTATPGKKVDWDLDFKNRAVIQIERPGQDSIDVDFEQAEEKDAATPNAADVKHHKANGASKDSNGFTVEALSSPAFAKSHRWSGNSFVDASLDPFVDDDGFVVGKGRKRTKFARPSGSWRLLTSPSPPNSPEREEGLQEQSISDVEATLQPPTDGERQLDLDLHDRVHSQADADRFTPRINAAAVEQPHSPDVLAESFAHEEMDRTVLIGESGTRLVTTVTIPTQTPPRHAEAEPSPAESFVHKGMEGPLLVGESGASPNTVVTPTETPPRHAGAGTSTEDLQDQAVARTPRLHPLPSAGLPLVSPFVVKDTTEYFNGRAINQSEFGPNTEVAFDIPQSVSAEGEFPSSVYEDSLVALSDDEDLSETREGSGGLRQPVDDIQVQAKHTYGDMGESSTDFEEVEAPLQAGPYASEDDQQDLALSEASQTEFDRVQAPKEQNALMLQSSGISQSGDDMSDVETESLRTDAELQSRSSSVEATTNELRHVTDQELMDQPRDLTLSQSPASEEKEEEEEVVAPSAKDGDSETDVPGTAQEVLSSDNSQTAGLAERPLALTPEATQQETIVTDTTDSKQSSLSKQGLPTPQKTQELPPETQEPAYSDVAHLGDQAKTFLPAYQETGNREDQSILGVAEVPARSTRSSTRISQPPQVSMETTSPYFTPRRSIQATSAPRPTPPLSQEDIDGKLRSNDTVHNLRPHKAKQGADEDVVPEHRLIRHHPPEQPKAAASLTTHLSYFVELASLSEHFNQVLDILAVSINSAALEPAQRAKSGPQDYHTSLHLADRSTSASDTVTVQIFRPYKSALPTFTRGDVVLLRNFKVQSQTRKCSLLSTESSAWAVFRHTEAADTGDHELQAEIAGPPVEYGSIEQNHVIALMKWWRADGARAYPELPPKQYKPRLPYIEVAASGAEQAISSPRRSRRLQSQPPDDTTGTNLAVSSRHIESRSPPLSSTASKKRRRSDASVLAQRPITSRRTGTRMSEGVVHELRDGTKYTDEDGDGTRKEDHFIHELRDGTKYTDNGASNRSSARKDASLVHELRDGVTYVDEQ